MRSTCLLALALLLGGCVHASRFRPVRADQAAPDEPASAYLEASGVKAWVRAGDWRGWPDDLENRVTPVEVFLENGGTEPLAVRPELFTLLTPTGFRAKALEPGEVQRLVAATWPAQRTVYFHAGYYGFYPWPAYPVRHHHVYPFAWWGFYPPPVVVLPPPAPVSPPGPPPVAQGTLERGGHVSLLLIFPVPATQLGGFELAVDLVTPAGDPRGTLRVAMVRADH